MDENQEVLTLGHKLPEEVCNISINHLRPDALADCPAQRPEPLQPIRRRPCALHTGQHRLDRNVAETSSPKLRTSYLPQTPTSAGKPPYAPCEYVRKVPDLQEHFLEKAKVLLQDRNHGVLLCGLTLITGMCEADEAEGGGEGTVEMFKPVVPHLVRTLKNLTSSGYTPEHDVSGITDPFLQVKILRLFRVLGRGDTAISEQINDILAQVATNTESTKNVGNAILYEAVLTILDIEADSGLRVLGVNILGKFLANKDNNIRYVALNTLIKVVAIEPNAVQRHRNTILECLRDPDISIRRRALDLSFTLIREDNVRILIRELLAFLEVADTEFKPVMTTQIGIAAERYAPNKRWHIDTMLRVVKLAGNFVKEQILASLIRLIATSPDQQTYAAQKLYAALKADITQEALTLSAVWVIGEYGDALLRGGSYEEEELVKEVKESDVVDLYTTILNSTYANQIVTEYIITSAMKMTTRMSDQSQIERIRRLMHARTADLSVEIQQRAVEYGNMFGYDAIRRGVLEKMPAPEIKEEQRVFGNPRAPAKDKRKALKSKTNVKVAKTTESDMLLDLMGGSDVPAVDVSATLNGNQQQTADLLADILGGGPVSSPPAQAKSPPPSSNTDSIMDLFGNGAQKSASPAPGGPTAHPAYSKNGLSVAIQVSRTGSGIQALARFKNTSAFEQLTDVGLQAAVPKSLKLTLQGINKSTLDGGDEATQGMKIVAATGVRDPTWRRTTR